MDNSQNTTTAARFCGSCGAAVAPDNAFCASCGAKLDVEPSTRLKAADGPSKPSKSGLLILLGIGGFGALAAFGLYGMMLPAADGSSLMAQTGPTDDQLGAQGAALVKASLRDPMSAIFTNVRGNVDEGCAYGTVNAKNGFGGYTGSDDYVVRQGAVTFKSGGLIPYMDVSGDCGADAAEKQLKTETDPKMRALLQNVIDAHKKAVSGSGSAKSATSTEIRLVAAYR